MSKVERDAELRLDDILQAVSRIRTYVADMTFAEFQASQLTFDAVAMNVLVIGESIGRLPERLKTQLGGLPWRAWSPFGTSSPTATRSWKTPSSGTSRATGWIRSTP